MQTRILLIPVFMALAACAAGGPSPSSVAGTDNGPGSGPPTLVTAICGDCHAVTADALSPNPQAPGFADIANSPGVTRETLVSFLSDAHNYPMQMDVDLAPEDIEAIADHMMTLKSEDYHRTPS